MVFFLWLYFSACVEIDLSAPEPTTVTRGETNIVFYESNINGVIHTADDLPISDAVITFDNEAVLSDNAGDFQMNGVAVSTKGSYFQVDHPQFAPTGVILFGSTQTNIYPDITLYAYSNEFSIDRLFESDFSVDLGAIRLDMNTATQRNNNTVQYFDFQCGDEHPIPFPVFLAVPTLLDAERDWIDHEIQFNIQEYDVQGNLLPITSNLQLVLDTPLDQAYEYFYFDTEIGLWTSQGILPKDTRIIPISQSGWWSIGSRHAIQGAYIPWDQIAVEREIVKFRITEQENNCTSFESRATIHTAPYFILKADTDYRIDIVDPDNGDIDTSFSFNSDTLSVPQHGIDTLSTYDHTVTIVTSPCENPRLENYPVNYENLSLYYLNEQNERSRLTPQEGTPLQYILPLQGNNNTSINIVLAWDSTLYFDTIGINITDITKPDNIELSLSACDINLSYIYSETFLNINDTTTYREVIYRPTNEADQFEITVVDSQDVSFIISQNNINQYSATGIIRDTRTGIICEYNEGVVMLDTSEDTYFVFGVMELESTQDDCVPIVVSFRAFIEE